MSRTGPLPSTARRSKTLPLCIRFVTRCRIWCSGRRVPQPRTGNATRLYHQSRFGLFPFRSPLLRESLLLSFPRGTEMFQFPRFPPPALCVQAGVTPHDGCRVSPFGHPRIEARSAAPRGFSQPPTSFIGIRRQGIHRWLFLAWNFSSKRCSCSLSNSQGARERMRQAQRRGSPKDDDTAGAQRRRRCDRTFKTEQRKDVNDPLSSARDQGLQVQHRAGRPSECINWVTDHRCRPMWSRGRKSVV